jgi:hypothetical protein
MPSRGQGRTCTVDARTDCVTGLERLPFLIGAAASLSAHLGHTLHVISVTHPRVLTLLAK